FVASFQVYVSANVKCFSMIVGINAMRFIVFSSRQRIAFGVIGGYINSAFIFPFSELHSVAGRIGITAPVFAEIIGCICLWLFGPMLLCGDVYRGAPGKSPVCRGLRPYLTQPFALPHFPLVVVTRIVKKENPALGISRVLKVHNRRGITGLQRAFIYHCCKRAPGMTFVIACFQYDIDISEITSIMYPSFCKSEQLAVG